MKFKDHAINVLLVEDSNAELLLINLALHESQLISLITLQVARNGVEALEIVKKSTKEATIDFILLDINLPIMSGLDVLKIIRQELGLQNIQIIVFSNSDYMMDIMESYKLGANAYVQKPADYDRLVKFCKTLKHSIEMLGAVNVDVLAKDLGEDLKTAPTYTVNNKDVLQNTSR
jgi:CheY-like chemotaxis protein